MSLFGSMTTAISGMNAQGKALGHISDNVANSQTVGYKRMDTRFSDLLTFSSPDNHLPGSVIARPEATNHIQGSVEQVENPLAMALNGHGFFAVSRLAGRTADGNQAFDGRQLFTRAGDFQMSRDGYLVNGSGDALRGWTVTNGVPDMTQLSVIRVPETLNQPVATDLVSVSANLPAASAAGATFSTEAQVYDALGSTQRLDLGWTKLANGNWRLDVTAPATATPLIGSVEVAFGATGAAAGTITGFSNATGALVPATGGTQASIAFPVNFGGGAQPMTLDLGAFGAADGVTQYSGSTYELRGVTRNGAPPGAFSSVSVGDDGAVVVNYDNGQSRTIAQVPVVTFPDPDALERLDGQAFAMTADAGAMRVGPPGQAGAGRISAGTVERSNVDIAAEFSKLIVAQRAYSANTRIVTASDELLQDTINMKR